MDQPSEQVSLELEEVAAPAEGSPPAEEVRKTSHKVEVGVAMDNFSLQRLLKFMGPGLLISIAYIDPGNIDADIASGANFRYMLVWILLLSSVMGLILQYLAAKLGIVTQMDLAQHCRASYPKLCRYFLWFMAEISVIASDIPEVLGTAIALQLLFKIPLWIGVLLTGADTLLFLALQNFSIRALEILIGLFVLIISFCFMIEMFLASPQWESLFLGLFPFYGFLHEPDKAGYIVSGISLMGAVVMPHNLYLHSALVQSRNILRNEKGIKESLRYNFIESGIAIFVSFLINLAIISVSASVFYGSDEEPGLSNASLLLQHLLNSNVANIAFAVALLASGQSSTITGTYAGQFVMEGFLDIKIVAWKRNIVTRVVAIGPSLVAALFYGNSGSDMLIILSQVILSIQLPFALIPLVKLTNSPTTLFFFFNSKQMVLLSWILAGIVTIANVMLVCFVLVDSLDITVWWQSVAMILLLGVGASYIGVIVFLALFQVDARSTAYRFDPHSYETCSTEEVDVEDTIAPTLNPVFVSNAHPESVPPSMETQEHSAQSSPSSSSVRRKNLRGSSTPSFSS